MIYVRIWEGLGNQLFQYAYARALQLSSNQEVRLCALKGTGQRSFRPYELDKFAITIKRDIYFEKMAGFVIRNEILKEFLRINLDSEIKKHWGYIEEKSVQYDERLKSLNGIYFLSGWFQNEKYFKEYEDVLRKEVRPKKKIKISKALNSILTHENTVSVHIRRGDYKRNNNVLDMGYYEKAFEFINEKVSDVFYVVFSDDLRWVKEHMQFGNNVYFVNEDKKLQDYEELFVMSRCRHNIIANSTFSWWGAWLNNNTDKLVIGPKRWFPNSASNIMPDTWIRL